MIPFDNKAPLTAKIEIKGQTFGNAYRIYGVTSFGPCCIAMTALKQRRGGCGEMQQGCDVYPQGKLILLVLSVE
jgi:hypothetical protein